MTENVTLSELRIEDWLESYRQSTKAAMGKEGPLNPVQPGTFEVVAGPYPKWHYTALAMLRVLETVVDQQEQIESLKSRIRLLERMAVEDSPD